MPLTRIKTSVIDPVFLTENKGTVANESAMLSVTGEVGDFVRRSDDGNNIWMIVSGNGSLITDWQRVNNKSYALAAGDYTNVAAIDLVKTDTSGNSVTEAVCLVGSGSTTVTCSGANVITVSSIGTTYTAGTGLTLTGTQFSNTAPDQTVSLTGSGATSITGTYPNFTVSSTDTTYSTATNSTAGLVKLFNNTDQSVAANAVSSTSNRTYGIQLNSSDQMVVNVPWTDTNTTYTAGTGLTLTGTQFSNTAPDQTVTLTGSGATSVTGTYPNFTISSTDTDTNTTYTAGTGLTLVGTQFSNTAPDQTVTLTGSGATSVTGTYPNFTVSSTNTTYSTATDSTAGLVKLFNNTDQSVAANSVSAVADRTYGIQLNSSDQMVVNVPWTGSDTVYTAAEDITAGQVVSLRSDGKVRLPNTVNLLRYVTNPSTSGIDRFGGVVISDSYYAVGASGEQGSGGQSNNGKVYLYNLSTGTLISTISNPNSTESNAYFGSGLDITDSYLVIGSSGSSAYEGKAYIYDTNGNLLHTLVDPNPDQINFGTSVSVENDIVVVGSPFTNVANTNSGQVHVYNAPTGDLLYTIDNPNAYGTSANDYFGIKVHTNGNYIVVSGRYEDDADGTDMGKTYVFDASDGSLLHTLDNPNLVPVANAADYFGHSAVVSDDYVVVGAYEQSVVNTTTYSESGAVHVFNVNTGSLLYSIANPNPNDTPYEDVFGSSVSINNSYILASAPGEKQDLDGNTTFEPSGKAYLFDIRDGALLYTIDNPNLGAGTGSTLTGDDNFGSVVYINNTHAIIGAPQDSQGDTQTEAGSAYIFELPNYNFIGIATENIDEGNSGIINVEGETNTQQTGLITGSSYYVNRFGNLTTTPTSYGIIGKAKSSTEILISNTIKDYNSGKNNYFTAQENITAGDFVGLLANRNIVKAGDKVNKLNTLDNPNAYSTSANDNFGHSVSISESYTIVGAWQEDDEGGGGTGTSSGKAYIFDTSTGNLLHTLDNPNAYNTTSFDYFGNSVSISESYAIVGAYQEDDAGGLSSGKAYIYSTSSGNLLYTLNNPNAYGTSAEDRFGESVSISETHAIVGAYLEGESGHSDSGKAYIYDLSTLTPGTVTSATYILDNPNAYDTPTTDYFGRAVSISKSYAIVGAYLEDELNNANSGKAYIYDLSTLTPGTGSVTSATYTLNNPNAYGTSNSDWFGRFVDISESYAIVGAYQEDDAGGSGSGKAYIYDLSTLTPGTVTSATFVLDNPNAYGTSADDNFGYSVSISESYAIVGAYPEDEANTYLLNGLSSGKAYIYDLSTLTPGTVTSATYILDNPNAYSSTLLNEFFGWSVSISKSYAIVGAYSEDDAGGSGSGKAYTFQLTTDPIGAADTNITAGNTGYVNTEGSIDRNQHNLIPNKVYYLDSSGNLTTSPTSYGIVGKAISSTEILISNTIKDYNSGKNNYFTAQKNISAGDFVGLLANGKISKVNDNLLYTLDNPNKYDTPVNDNFGTSVAISESYAIVGAYKEDDAGGSDSGKAYIYDISTGNLLYTLDNPTAYGTSYEDRFGYSVSISESYAIVGAYGEDDETNNTNSGKAYIYDLSTLTPGTVTNATFVLDNPNVSTNDYFGFSVSISESYAIVGAYGEDDTGALSSGKAYIYDLSTLTPGTVTSETYTLDNPNASNSDQFGSSVSISESYAIVGVPNEDDPGGTGTDSGKAYIYDNSTGNLLYTLDNPTAYGTSSYDNFGISVAISESYAIVGASYEDEAGAGNSGKAYIYDTSTGNLLYTLDNPNAYGIPSSDNFGRAVSISESYAIVGAYPEDDAGGTDSGKAYIYDLSTLTPGTVTSATYTLNNPNAYGTSSYDYFGWSVSISKSYAIVGAYGEDDTGALSSGKAYMYALFTSYGPIGAADTNITAGNTGYVNTVGSIDGNQRNLIPSEFYYLDSSGNLTTSPTDSGIVGKAISSTELQILIVPNEFSSINLKSSQGNWKVENISNNLYFSLNGVYKMKLYANGNLEIAGTLTEIATIT